MIGYKSSDTSPERNPDAHLGMTKPARQLSLGETFLVYNFRYTLALQEKETVMAVVLETRRYYTFREQGLTRLTHRNLKRKQI